MTEKGELLYEGKAKKLYKTSDEGVLWVAYQDQATALNGARKEQIAGKGELNNQITSLIFEKLNQAGFETHFIKMLSKTEQLNREVEIIPLEVVLRNVAAGSFSKRLGINEGEVLPEPIVEFYYKDDALDDPFINDEHVRFLNLATEIEIEYLKKETRRINDFLKAMWAELDLTLIDFKLEFGRLPDGQIILADEISPDTSRLWAADGSHMDKDVFRRNLGDLISVYEKVLEKLEAAK
ncbi:phosphoribosylaminoimidazolesuccinocarboxamide synthase [Lactococcus termiticola]|uniref:Phosphoribosylaminoimidazole-succinocarboxamide synthase n=1 Tax=Lactococcus termiticola TaxID=2169526 RepID=A0A2R5HDQ5_9LACT|nr:phosphoribosylaminoimidazolesuccinocarboxamide synthase [Lactococcus termiticola]GBG96193.1 phosphoribosylaminoimidazole-succinocarboxamide synthase [Lactococcus termiticola]